MTKKLNLISLPDLPTKNEFYSFFAIYNHPAPLPYKYELKNQNMMNLHIHKVIKKLKCFLRRKAFILIIHLNKMKRKKFGNKTHKKEAVLNDLYKNELYIYIHEHIKKTTERDFISEILLC